MLALQRCIVTGCSRWLGTERASSCLGIVLVGIAAVGEHVLLVVAFIWISAQDRVFGRSVGGRGRARSGPIARRHYGDLPRDDYLPGGVQCELCGDVRDAPLRKGIPLAGAGSCGANHKSSNSWYETLEDMKRSAV